MSRVDSACWASQWERSFRAQRDQLVLTSYGSVMPFSQPLQPDVQWAFFNLFARGSWCLAAFFLPSTF